MIRCQSDYANVHYIVSFTKELAKRLTIRSATPKRRAELHVAMCQIQYRLREICRLHDAPHLDHPFVLNQLPHDA